MSNAKEIKIGIQGGPGSFNHQAIIGYCEKNGVASPEIVFLYTTEKVLSAVENGEVDLGQFAISNSLGGLVEETMEAIGRRRFKVKDNYCLAINHCLMAKKGAGRERIEEILSHEQSLKQCERYLSENFPGTRKTAGKGEFSDPARIALAISSGELPEATAMIGPEGLAEAHGLEVIAENIQNSGGNITTFLLVESCRD